MVCAGKMVLVMGDDCFLHLVHTDVELVQALVFGPVLDGGSDGCNVLVHHLHIFSVEPLVLPH